LPKCLNAGAASTNSQKTYPWDFLWLLRLNGDADRNEHGAKCNAGEFFAHALLSTHAET
jgi:hypothetical protein